MSSPMKTCKRGHDLGAAKIRTSGGRSWRECRSCVQIRRKARRHAAGRTMNGPQINRAERFCPGGHEYRGRNVCVIKRKWWSVTAGEWRYGKCRDCRECRKEKRMDARALKLGLPLKKADQA